MAIRKEDWPAINQAISDAISPLKPRGWRKALFLLREWGVLGTVATLTVALLALAGAGCFITSSVEKPSVTPASSSLEL
jgi:hypothetical protein